MHLCVMGQLLSLRNRQKHYCLTKLYYVMKISVIVLGLVMVSTSLLVAKEAHTQSLDETRVTLELKGSTLKSAFAAIEQQTPYRFMYNSDQVNAHLLLNYTAKNKVLRQVLQDLLKAPHYQFLQTDKTLLIKPEVAKNTAPAVMDAPVKTPDNIVITGVVSDDQGKPIPGVSVSQKGTQNGVITDANGAFSISLPDMKGILMFSMIGYGKQEIAVEGRLVVTVQLKAEAGSLGEVVILGFGQKQSKIAQTGAISSVGSKELKQSPTANLTNALAGRLPGLVTMQRGGEPGNDAAMLFIRGRATFNGGSPLVTIDGIQKDYSAITLLDVNEIESVTILKDASATALYGVKGANGVVIVTTKRGANRKPEMSMTVETAFQNPVSIPKFLDSYNYALLANEAYLNDNPTSTPLYSKEALEAYRTNSNPLRYPNVDWFDEAMKTGMQKRLNFNLTGGSPIARYFINVGYVNQDGVYRAEKNNLYDPNANFKRYNFRSNVDIDFNKDFTIGLSLYGAIEDKRNPNYDDAGIFWTLLQVPPNYAPVKWPGIGLYGQGNDVQNPLWLVNESGYAQSFNSSLSGMLTAAHKLDFITKGLSVKANYSFDGYFRNSQIRWARSRTAKYNNGYFEDPASYTYFFDDLPLQAPSSSYTQNRDVWLDMSLNYDRSFGDHSVTGLLLANRTQKVTGSAVPYVSQGLVGRLVYNYKQKYFAEINGSYNGTDNFARNNRYGFFPAISAGYLVSKEEFMRALPAISMLKIRGSYGQVGSDQFAGRRWPFISEYNGTAGYQFGETLSNGIGGIGEGAMANPDITWEVSTKSNVGLELGLWDNMLSLKADYFMEKRSNILITRNTVPGVIGASGSNLPAVNWGKVNNQGYELELNHRNRIGAVNYFLNTNFTFARNKVIFIDEAPTAYPWQAYTGRPIGQQYGLTAIGFFQSQDDIDKSPKQFGKVIPGDIKYADLNNDGVIDNNDEGVIGRSNSPEIFYGISGGINWKNFDISFLLQGSGLSYRPIMWTGMWEFFQGGKVADLHQGRWTPETAATATYPALHYGASANNFRASSFYLDNTSYLRLKNVEIGYTFRKVSLNKHRELSSVRIYANGVNLYTWTRARLYDPENYSGYGAVYPPTRVINFGLSVNF